MMKLSVLLLLPLLALSSASPLDVWDNTEQRNDLNGSAEINANRSPLTDPSLRTVSQFRQSRQVVSSPLVSDDTSMLEWVTWNNALPNDAVSIYNEYVGHTDYICKFKCHAGFYRANKGPYCHYVNEKKEQTAASFEILVNKNNFEMLEWKGDSHGSVPQKSVRTCPGFDIYVGKNQYGLGKVSTPDKIFYLPWNGGQYSYTSYEVLTVGQNIISQHIDDVRYDMDKSKIVHYPPEVMRETTINNFECQPVTKRDTLSKTYQVEKRWDFLLSLTAGVKTTLEVGVPHVAKDGIEISTEVTLEYTQGSSVIESITDTISVDMTAPPKHSCTVSMERHKTKLDIPFTARISRRYGNGEVRTRSISGTYNGVQVVDITTKVSRCELLKDSNPCP